MASKVSKLNVFLSNLAVMNVKIHNLHWNVVGPEFPLIHEMTERLYKMFEEQFDTVAEVMKMQGEYPLGSLEDYLNNATAEELETRDFGEVEVLEILDEDCQKIMDFANEVREEAEKNDNFQVVNLMEEYLEVYAKYHWFVRSMLLTDEDMGDMDMLGEENEEAIKEKDKKSKK